MRKILSLTLFLLTLSANAQDYFQQDVEYKIEVTLDDKRHELRGFETVKYKNNSKDALPFIYFHLWPNAYKNNNTALGKQLTDAGNLSFHFAKDEDRGYIDSLNFMADGRALKMESDPEHIDICKIILEKPLQPGESITITTPFHVKIPSAKFSRLGHIDQSYQISQWYPKPAVYDRNGWNQMPYLNQGEFYSEFGTFDVYITLPSNYVVGSTGDLVNGEKELSWLDDKAKKTAELKEFDKKDLSFPPSDAQTKTLHYHQEKVHDFAWFADKRFHVLKGEVELPHSKRKVTTWTMFTNAEGKLWMKSIEYMNDAIYYYSLWNGDYPYNHATAVDGTLSAGAGMEYPNVTVIGTSGNSFALETVIMHEVGHNWFYGILGSNERMHPWMDEGINSFNEMRYIRTKYPDRKLLGDAKVASVFDLDRLKQKAQYELAYLINARRNLDQPIELPAHEYTDLNYGGIVYSKTALTFDYLRSYLGTDVFDRAMKRYFEEWKFRHPQPADLKKVIESESGKNLDWFFNDLIGTTKKLDFKICNAAVYDKGYPEVLIKNKSDFAAPVHVCGILDGKMRGSIWYDMTSGKGEKTRVGIPPGNYDKYVIDFQEEIPETHRKNNTYRTRGMFKKVEPLKIQFLGSVENPGRTQLFFAPIGGWNKYDGGMAGLAIYNHAFPERKFQYTLAPMYGFGSNKVTGFASVSQTFFTQGIFRSIRLGVNARTFSLDAFPEAGITASEYFKVAPELKFDLKNKRGRSKVVQQIRLREVIVNESFQVAPDALTELRDRNVYVGQLSYSFNNKRKLNPYSFGFAAENNQTTNSEYTKLSGQASYYLSYNGKKNQGISLRAFAGHMFSESADLRFMFGFGYPSSGMFDYTYDHLYLGRMETTGFLSQQIVEKDAGFIHATSLSFRNTSIASLNIKAGLPFKLPVYIYANAGTANNVKGAVIETGAAFSLIRNICEIYFPAYLSHPAAGLSYAERIRFTLNLHLANPFDLARDISL